jgi:hypothetical protein
VTLHEVLERAAEMNSADRRTGADEPSCTSAPSPVATGPALTYAGRWSHIFAAALDLSLERRFEPATGPHTAVAHQYALSFTSAPDVLRPLPTGKTDGG